MCRWAAAAGCTAASLHRAAARLHWQAGCSPQALHAGVRLPHEARPPTAPPLHSHTCWCQVLDRGPGRDEVQLQTLAPGDDAELIFILTLTATDPTNPVRSVRVLPAAGGICAGDPFTEVGGAAACSPPQRYRPYLLAHVQIMFMPQFLAGLRPYRWAGGGSERCLAGLCWRAGVRARFGVPASTVQPTRPHPLQPHTRRGPCAREVAACTPPLARLVRFMDWQRTNNAAVQRIGQRAFREHAFWSTDRWGEAASCGACCTECSRS